MTKALSMGVFFCDNSERDPPRWSRLQLNTYSWISTVPEGSEQSEWASPWTKQASEASEWSECSKAERCGASERSERCEWTNIVSDRVALSKRDCVWLETQPKYCYTKSSVISFLLFIVFSSSSSMKSSSSTYRCPFLCNTYESSPFWSYCMLCQF